MTKELSLRILMLLSALESHCYANKARIPEHLDEEMCKITEELRKEVLA